MGPVDHLVTSGTFSLDGGTWDVDNNVWIVGDEHEVIVVDAAHDPDEIATAVGDRRVVAIVCTHAHDDHVEPGARAGRPLRRPDHLLNPAEAPLWEMTHPDRKPDHDLCDGDVLTAGGIELRAIMTPGHSPGSTCLYAPELGTVFTGDTLFQGGPGATGPVVLVVRHDHRLDPARGCSRCPATPGPHRATATRRSIGAEAPHLEEWIVRGH